MKLFTITSNWNLKQSTPLVDQLHENEQIFVDFCHLVGDNSSYSSISSTSRDIRYLPKSNHLTYK